MLTIFRKRKTKPTRELAPVLTLHERRALQSPFFNGGPVPPTEFEQMERDAMVQTALTLKRLGVLAAPWTIEPADGGDAAKRNAEFVAECFTRMEGSPETILSQAMGAFSRGWSVQELVYAPRKGQIVLEAARPKDVSKFGLDLDAFGRLRALRLQLPGEPEIDLPRAKFVVFRNRPESGRPKGVSDLEAAHPHWRSKSSLLGAWREHLERFASPTLLGQYQRGLPPEELATLINTLDTLRSRTSLVFPHDVDVSALALGKEASTGYVEAIEFHNREITRSILGQTLTTDEGRRVGSLALGKVHLQVLLLQLAALRRQLADSVMTEQVIRPLVELNFGPGSIPRFMFEESPLPAFRSGSVE